MLRFFSSVGKYVEDPLGVLLGAGGANRFGRQEGKHDSVSRDDEEFGLGAVLQYSSSYLPLILIFCMSDVGFKQRVFCKY